MVRNIIEDSDDEGDFDTLRRDIAAAHRDVIEKSALPNGTVNSLDSSDRWSSPVTSRKRKSAVSSLEPRETPSKKTDQKKTSRTYGQPDRRNRDLLDEDNGAFEAMRREEKHIGGFTGSTGQLGGKEPPLQTREDGYLVGDNQTLLPGSLQDDFAQHEPAVMFPTMMSSTVPDATITQQRLLEAARAEFHQDHHMSPSGFTAKIIENPSVSWSEYLESTEAIDESVKESIRAVRASRATRVKNDDGSETLTSDDFDIGLPKQRYIPKPRRSRSDRSTVEEPDYSVRPEKTAKENAARRKTSETSNSVRRKQPKKEKANEVIPMGFDLNTAGETLRQHGNNLESAVESLLQDASNEANVVENGAMDGQSQADRPQAEKAAMAADMLLPPTEAIQAITPGRAKRKRGRPPKNRHQEGAGNTIVMEQRQASIDEAQYSQADSIDELQQVMPPVNRSACSEQDVTQEEQLLHDPGFEEDTTRARHPSPIVRPTPTNSARPAVVDEMQHVEESKPKKRGRGRPRATQKLQEAAAINVDESRVPVENPPHEENENSQETQPNTNIGDGKSDDNHKAARRGEEATLGAPPNAATALGSRSSEQPSEKHEVETDQKAAAKVGPAQPSPLGQGKVPVRVGLSRRARIAPLLKIVKK
ncbi:hypothetical protein SLS56_002028 [Neofusicoccum ribis]|uniref:UBA domain-containing protein n=1 Tax=Neofusicoccum ribis TaxID=45134 RepID=A0ABR3T6F9_9PEZI